MKLREAIGYAEKRLSSVSDEPGTEARILVSELTGKTRAEIAFSDETLSESTAAALGEAIERRLAREPLQYVLGKWWFMGLEFAVGPEALIPRQDTETLAEEALRLIEERGYMTLLDICTGTGCIAVSLAKLSGIRAEASDVSPECALLAKKNAEKNGVFINVRTADLFEGAGVYDIVTANPPYISAEDMALLSPEVKREPALALSGGEDGLGLYRIIAKTAGEHIAPGGALLLEVGAGEAEAVAAMFPGREARIIKDLNGVERVVSIDH